MDVIVVEVLSPEAIPCQYSTVAIVNSATMNHSLKP